MVVFYDIETTPIPIEGISGVKEIHCILLNTLKDPNAKAYTSKPLNISDGTLEDGVEVLNKAKGIVDFNGSFFDIPVIERIMDTKLKAKHIDLLTVCKIMFTLNDLYRMDTKLLPNNKELWGSYSLKAFALRFKLPVSKIEFSEFDKLTTEMVVYGKRDVEVTRELYKKLVKMPTFPNKDILRLEDEVARIIREQMHYGFKFNIEKAKKLNLTLSLKKRNLERKLQAQFKPLFMPEGEPKEVIKPIIKNKKIYLKYYKQPKVGVYVPRLYKILKNGKLRLLNIKKHGLSDKPFKIIKVHKEGWVQDIKLTKFKGTDKQIQYWLKHLYNFEFSTYTLKGNVSVDRDELKALGEFGKDLTTLIKVKKDLSQLHGDRGLIPSYREDTGTITSKIDTNGTNTGRFTSSSGNSKEAIKANKSIGVNLHQIPAQKEFRELFDAPKGWVFVGSDFDGQEAVILSQLLYPYSDFLYKVITEGSKAEGTDLHSLNAKVCNITRDEAKPVFFGLLYGSSATLTGFTVLGNKEYNEFTDIEFDKAFAKLRKRVIFIDDITKEDKELYIKKGKLSKDIQPYYPISKNRLTKLNDKLVIQSIFGGHIQEKIKKNLIGFNEAVKDLNKNYQKDNAIYTRLGRRIEVDSRHKLVNYYCQGNAGEAIKVYLKLMHERLKEAGLIHGKDYIHQATIYDEVDLICREEVKEKVKDILDTNYKLVSDNLNMDVTFTGNTLIGRNWYECH